MESSASRPGAGVGRNILVSLGATVVTFLSWVPANDRQPLVAGRAPRVWPAMALGMALLAFAATGCNHAPPPMPPLKDPQVDVSIPIYRDITDHEEFTGQTEAVDMIDIRARVTGYLKAVHFRDGAEVEKGAPLFDIDPPYYEAEAERTEGAVAQAEARLARLRLDYDRAERLLRSTTITKEQFDLVAGDMAEAEPNLRTAKAQRKIARVNLGYCQVKSPVSGRLSRSFIDPGNIVKTDDTLLTRIVAQDPMEVTFDLNERTMLRLKRLVKAGATPSLGDAGVPVFIGLADEEGFPRKGRLNFEDNQLDASTGTLRVRGIFENHDRLLTPGMFVRVLLPIGEPYRALLVPEAALATDQGQKFLYVIGADDKVEYRRVKVGQLVDGLRVVTEGVSPGERVVVNGVQRVRPGIKVEPQLVRNGTDERMKDEG
jgi:RND family efflux transporter MFP subunit